MVHRIISSSNLELEERRETSNGVSCRVAQNVAVFGLILITEVLILMDWGPIVTKQLYGVQIAFRIVLSILVFTAWIRLGWPGILHGVKGRIQVFLMLLFALIVNGMVPALTALTRQRHGSLFVSLLLLFLQVIFFFFCFFFVQRGTHASSTVCMLHLKACPFSCL